jgi:hypothetical protein
MKETATQTTYLRDIRMRIKEKFGESLSENVIAILIWTMLENDIQLMS